MTKNNAHPLINHVAENGDIICGKCEEWKPPSEFHVARRMKRGRATYCKPCMKGYSADWNDGRTPEQREARNAHRVATGVHVRYGRRLRAEEPERAKDHYLRYRYGVSYDEHTATLEAQDGRCALASCEGPAQDWDHDHRCCPGTAACGECTRGLVCHRCNVILGSAHEDPEVLTSWGYPELAAWVSTRFRTDKVTPV
jgi:hypothetical protein